jgi:hypothetical protein
MNRTLFVVVLTVMLGIFAVAQDSRLQPPPTLLQNTQAVPAQPGAQPTVRKPSSYEPPFCPPRNCLYYAGDFETSYSSGNVLLDTNDNNGQIFGQVWVGVKPERDATVTGATFVVMATQTGVGVNPTPFAIQVGITQGKAGKTVCSTSGNATETEYQDFEFLYDYAYTIKRLSKPCKLKKGHVYYVNLLPTFTDAITYAINTQPEHPPNHHGWKNDLNDCYFNSPIYGSNYVTCNSMGIGSHGFSEFSVALTGKE